MNYQNRSDLRFLVKIVFWIALLLLVVALPKALAFDAPATITEGELLTITFAGGELHKDGSIVAQTSPYEWQTTNADAGLYDFTHYVNGSPVDSKTVEVIDKPLSFTINKPAQTEYATNTIPIELTAASVDFCYYVLGAESNTLDKTNNIHTGEVIRPDGIYTIALKCKLGAEVATQERTVLIDTAPPGFISSSPATGATLEQASITISVTTNEVASCTAQATTEANAASMATIDRLTHERTIAPGAGTHNYVITCTDNHGNSATKQLSFTTTQSLSAEIDLEGDDTLTAGTYEVTVKTNVPVTSAELRYNYQGDGGGTIALTQDDEYTWQGNLVLPDNEGEKAGYFTIELTDANGDMGTTITEGKLFVIDTIAPGKVENVRLQNEASETSSWLRVSWTTDDVEDGLEFNVYRSTQERVSKADFLASTNNLFLEDRTAKEGQTYYYAVAAMDEAGNVGPLSVAAVSTVKPTSVVKESTEQAYEADQLEQRLAKAILDLETTISTLEQERDPQKLLVVQEAQLLANVQALHTTLAAAQKQLSDYGRLSPAEFEQKMTALDQTLAKVNGVIPTRISIESSITYPQTSTTQAQGSILAAAQTIFGSDAQELDNPRTKAAYQNDMQTLMEQSTVTVEIITAKITFANREETGLSTITKQLLVPSHAEDYRVIEYVPKTVGGTSSFSWGDGATILADDTFVQYELPSGQNELSISYTVPKTLDLATARLVRSVVLPPLVAPEVGAVTGNAILGGMEVQFSYWLGALIIAGLLVYYFFTDPAPKGLDQLTKAIAQLAQNQRAPVYFERRPQTYFTRKQQSYFPPPGPTRILPSAALRAEPAVPQESVPEQLTPLEALERGHKHIDEKNYIVAKQHYQEAIARLTEPNADADALYYKLLLYQKMQAAAKAADNDEGAKLNAYLRQLQDIAQKVPEEDTALILDAKQSYRDLKRVANKLAIDQDVF